MPAARTERAYQQAKARYAEVGVDTEAALSVLGSVPVSIHCWQGDDVRGFEHRAAALAGSGIQVTGSHAGRARSVDELRADLDKALSLIPGRHRLNLHAMYGEFGGKNVDRDEIAAEHYQGWVEWAGEQELGLDFNATCFGHPKAESGFTLSHRDKGVRAFWIEHVKRCREIGAWMGRANGTPCVHNLWIPDGSKDIPIDRFERRSALREALDEIYAAAYDPAELKDSLESKLFGIGSESFVVGSHEFYLAYALRAGKMICLDLGHFHPTESVADKVSALLQFFEGILLHVSRGIRWDSDHVVILTDEVRELMREVVRSRALGRVHIALDYFDASMSRVGAWVIGARATLLGLLMALLESGERVGEADRGGDAFARLAWLEESKALPIGDVWDYFCLRSGVPIHGDWIEDVQRYDETIAAERGR